MQHICDMRSTGINLNPFDRDLVKTTQNRSTNYEHSTASHPEASSILFCSVHDNDEQ